MGTSQRVDAIDLDEPQLFKHLIQVSAATGSRFLAQQQVTVQKETAGTLIV
jgi:hypothetical protein